MVTFDITLHRAMQERALEMINAERKLKEKFFNDEYTYKNEDEARALVKSLSNVYNGKTIESNVLELSKQYIDLIKSVKDFSSSISLIELSKDYINKQVEDAIFAEYIAIWDVLNMIDQKDWVDIEDWKVLNDENEEDISVKDFLEDYIKSNIENRVETEADLVEFICQFGIDDIYIRMLENSEDENDNDIYIVLFDENENRLTDIYEL